MLFNSDAFILVFLPVALLGYFIAQRLPQTVSLAWLALCSLVFYGYWSAPFVLLLLISIAFNYTAGELIARQKPGAGRSWTFGLAIAANLAALGGFKYLAPLVNFLGDYGVLAGDPDLEILLPLGISFFTFTQIGYLVDRRDDVGEPLDPLRYTVFVTFFPHLIAGPILHIREIGPQLRNPETFKLRFANVAPGLTLFVIGLAKKVLLADPLAGMVETGFGASGELTVISAWATVIGYSVQLYFDFSGYSDMAIGLAGMFGFRFPLNFNSPFKSKSVIEYWQRWHMSLSRYLQLLLYNPMAMWVTRRRMSKGLKMSPKALARPGAFASMVMLPTFYTMVLAGIWHGAGLQFLIFGVIHAIYLCIAHGWRLFGPKPAKERKKGPFDDVWKIALTYITVLLPFTFFRASSAPEAFEIVAAAFGANGIGHYGALDPLGITDKINLAWIAVGLAIIWLAPNSQQIMGKFAPTLEEPAPMKTKWFTWRPTTVWACASALLLCACLIQFSQSTTFLYYQF